METKSLKSASAFIACLDSLLVREINWMETIRKIIIIFENILPTR